MFEELFKSFAELLAAGAKLFLAGLRNEDALPYWLKIIGLSLPLVAYTLATYYWLRKIFRDRIQKVLVDPEAFWSKAAAETSIAAYSKRMKQSIPVIALANYKGGVGKSMISANLAAYFDKLGYRVLLIDYDYQGSLTDIVPYADPDHLTFTAHAILKGDRASGLRTSPQKLGQSFRHSYIHPAEADLSRIDSELIFQWLTGAISDDVRFNTHRYVASDFVQKQFDIVIIDTPPRICAATANALCAANLVVIPTILDTVSSRAVFRSVEMFLNFRDKLGLSFRIFGVVPSKVNYATRYDNRESQAIAYLKSELGKYERFNRATHRKEAVPVLDHLPIMQRVALLHIEGDDMAIFSRRPDSAEAVVQEMFAKLGNAILNDMGLKASPTPETDPPHENVGVTESTIQLREPARASAR